ncbi:MAG TPA: hypothetical protein VFS00_02155 [Polyangiaceae bacterium]|nr:hypothetical protein [Polyangiaceae bacterium]
MLALAFGALTAAAAPACGGEGDGEGPATVPQFLEQYETTLCDLVGGCCAESGLPSEPAGCPGAARASFPEVLFDETKYAYDRAGAAACLAALRSLGATCAPFREGAFGPGSAYERACGRAFAPRGVAGPGAACDASWQCAAASEPDALAACELRDGADGNFERACAWSVYAGAGEACDTGLGVRPDARAGVTRRCQPGPLYCANDGTCQAPAAPGQPCERGAAGACRGGSFCNAAAQCEALRGRGAGCAGEPGACDGTSFCDQGASNTCLARRGEGAPCADSSQCQGGCVGGACSAPLPDRREDYSMLCGAP